MRKLVLLFVIFASVGMTGCTTPARNNQVSYQWSSGSEQDMLTQVKQAAEHGDADAQFDLGVMYTKGEGVAKVADARKAYAWFRKAAERGHPIAQHLVGEAYLNGIGGVAKDEKRAREWLIKATPGLRTLAEQGNAWARNEAQFRLAINLMCGVPGEPGVAKDEAQAMKWLKKAAAQGDERAQEALNFIKRAGGDVCSN